MTRDEIHNELIGKYATGDFLREVHAIGSTDSPWDRLRLSCGHELMGSKGTAVLRDKISCGLCAKAWVEDHTE